LAEDVFSLQFLYILF